MAGYNQKMLDHFTKPRNSGTLHKADGFGMIENPVNGYITEIYLKINNDKIVDIKFRTMGCVVTIASNSALTEIVKNKTIQEILDSKESIEQLIKLVNDGLGEVPERSWHCPVTSVLALYLAMIDYFRKQSKENSIELVEQHIKYIEWMVKNKLSQ